MKVRLFLSVAIFVTEPIFAEESFFDERVLDSYLITNKEGDLSSNANRRLRVDVPQKSTFYHIPMKRVSPEELKELPPPSNTLDWKCIAPQDSTSFKTIIVHYYGGLDRLFLKSSLETDQNDFSLNTQAFLTTKAAHFFVETNERDSFFFQSFQVSSRSTGKTILKETTLSFIKFIRELRKIYPEANIIYQGASFGGFKGAFINALLSNMDALDEYLDSDLFDFFKKELQEEDKNLFNGFVLDSGAYSFLAPELFCEEHIDGFFSKLFFNMRYKFIHPYSPTFKKMPPLAIPTLIAHNFDDERVDILEALKLYKARSQDPIILQICTQAAPSIQQPYSPSVSRYSSTEGHFSPAVLSNDVFKIQYLNAIKEFLTTIEQNLPIKKEVSNDQFILYSKLRSDKKWYRQLFVAYNNFSLEESDLRSLWTKVEPDLPMDEEFLTLLMKYKIDKKEISLALSNPNPDFAERTILENGDIKNTIFENKKKVKEIIADSKDQIKEIVFFSTFGKPTQKQFYSKSKLNCVEWYDETGMLLESRPMPQDTLLERFKTYCKSFF